MDAKGVWRTLDSNTNWHDWEWIGGSGGGYSFEYQESDMDAVPKWAKQILQGLDDGDRFVTAAYDQEFFELIGKKYIYRLVPGHAGQGNAAVDILRREKVPKVDVPRGKSTAKGAWRLWNSKLSPGGVRREWRRKGWQQIGQVQWHPAGFKSLLNWLPGGRVNSKLVPKWVHGEFSKRLNDEGAPISHAQSPLYYELKGKRYSYRIVPTFIETDIVVADVFSSFRKSLA